MSPNFLYLLVNNKKYNYNVKNKTTPQHNV